MMDSEVKQESKVEPTVEKKEDVNTKILETLQSINDRLSAVEKERQIELDAIKSAEKQQRLIKNRVEEYELQKKQDEILEQEREGAFDEFVKKLKAKEYSQAEIDRAVINDDPYFLTAFYKAVYIEAAKRIESEMGSESKDITKDFNIEEFKMKYARKNKQIYAQKGKDEGYIFIDA